MIDNLFYPRRMGQKAQKRGHFYVPHKRRALNALTFSWFSALMPCSGIISDLCFHLCEFLRKQSYYLSHTLPAWKQICKQKASESSVITWNWCQGRLVPWPAQKSQMKWSNRSLFCKVFIIRNSTNLSFGWDESPSSGNNVILISNNHNDTSYLQFWQNVLDIIKAMGLEDGGEEERARTCTEHLLYAREFLRGKNLGGTGVIILHSQMKTRIQRD